MQGIFTGRTQLRYRYGRYGYTRGGGKIWHGGMDIVGLDSTSIRMPYYKNKRITGKVVRARRVTDHTNLTWEWGWYVCVQLDANQTPDEVNFLYFCHCRELKVKAGDRVASGDLLAIMGQSGNAAGSYDHCHLEARATANGRGLDPSQYAGCPNAVGVYGEAESLPESDDAAKKSNGAPAGAGGTAGESDAAKPSGAAGTSGESDDAAKKMQIITVGPVTRGDADAVYTLCASRGLVKAGLYKSEWSV